MNDARARAIPREPTIRRVNAKIARLERKLGHLEEKIAEGRGSEAALRFDREDHEAIEAGILALRLYLADVEGLDDPVLVLGELVDAIENDRIINGHDLDDRSGAALGRARKLVKEWGERG